MKKMKALLLCGALVTAMLAGCGGGESSGNSGTETNSKSTGASADSTSDEKDGAESASDIVVGFSTGAAGTTFRQEGIDDFTVIAEEYKAEGRIKDYKIVNNTTNWDSNEQANIVRDFINDEEVNVIVVNPNSPTDLNGVLAEAVEAGKTVVAVDCEVDVEGVYCVSIDHYAWGERIADYIADALDGQGNVIQVYGGEGHPANNERIRATEDVLSNYPDIKMVSSTSGGWDNQTAKQVTSQILGGGAQIDGVITQDSMGYGCLSAFDDLGIYPKAAFIECGTANLKLYDEIVEQGIEMNICSQPNPPSIVASGLRIAVNLAEGKELDETKLGGLYGRACIYDVKYWFTNDNLDELRTLLEGKGDDYLLTEYWTEEEAQAFFK